MRLPFSISVLGLVVACSGDNTFIKFKPDIVVAPPNLDFGEVVVEYSDTLNVEIFNDGREDLNVESVTFDGQRGGAFSIDFPEPIVVEPQVTAQVPITFKPPTYLPYTDTILVLSDDPDSPSIPVRLFGEGVDGEKPDIAVSDLSVDFGTVDIGDDDITVFSIGNEGEGDLEITSVTISGDDAAAFTMMTDPTGQVVTGGSFTSTGLVYTPTDEDGDSATLTIESTDPDESPLVIPLLGNGGGAYEFPVAVLSCPDEAAPLQTLRFDGSESYDPEGHEPLDYAWALSQAPDGSRAELTANTGTSEMLVDLAGTYSVSLTVRNSIGLYSPAALCTFEAIPTDALHVELIWNTNNSDLDLHLIQGGAEIFDPEGDVCFCNPEPTWGDSLDTTDDPTLDLDDMYGYGPENINIEEPADDTYTIAVHYYQDNGGGATTATVRIYLWGALVQETYALMEKREIWNVGTVSWPDGTVTLDGSTDSSALRYCGDE